jgi:hypothetical protein
MSDGPISRSVDLSERFSVDYYDNETRYCDLKLTNGKLLAFGCRVIPCVTSQDNHHVDSNVSSQGWLIECPSKVVFCWDCSHGSCAALLTCSSST